MSYRSPGPCSTLAWMLHPATLKTLALTCMIGGPVLHGLLGPIAGASAVAVGLLSYLLGLALAVRTDDRRARTLAALSLAIGGWCLLSWAWVRFGPARVDSVPLGVDPLVGQIAIGVEIAALYAASRQAPKIWIWVLVGLWTLSWPPLTRALFVIAPQVAVLMPSIVAIAAMIVFSQIARIDRATSGPG